MPAKIPEAWMCIKCQTIYCTRYAAEECEKSHKEEEVKE